MKKLLILFLFLFSFNIYTENNNKNEIISKILTLNLTEESEHLVITKFTENNTVSIFTHENVLFVLEKSNLNYINKNEVIRLITLIDKMLEKRKQFYELAKTFTTYHILHLNEMKEYDPDTNKNIEQVFRMIKRIDSSLIQSIRQIQEIYQQEQ